MGLGGGLDEGGGAIGDEEAAASGELADDSAGEWGHPQLPVDLQLRPKCEPNATPANLCGPVGVAGSQYIGSTGCDDPYVVVPLGKKRAQNIPGIIDHLGVVDEEKVVSTAISANGFNRLCQRFGEEHRPSG